MAGTAEDANSASPAPVTQGALFAAFLKIGLTGFGGVLPLAHRVLVNERRWLSERGFVDALSLCQFLPGPNVVNLSIVVGQRYRGVAGSLMAFTGLVAVPLVIVLALGILYTEYGKAPVVDRILGGVSAAAAGLVWAMGAQMARTFARIPRAVIFAALAFVGLGVLQLPILPLVAVLAPASVLAAWWRR